MPFRFPATIRGDSVIYDARGKILSAGPESYEYSPLGGIVSGLSGRIEQANEQFTVDGYGRILHRTLISADGSFSSNYRYGAGTAHLDTVVTANGANPDTTSNGYDAFGALTIVISKHNIGSQTVKALSFPSRLASVDAIAGRRRGFGPGGMQPEWMSAVPPMSERTLTSHVYDSFGMLTSTSARTDTLNDPSGFQHAEYETREKNRYDALGRRVWTGMLRCINAAGDCAHHDLRSGCHNTATWTFWDGDQMIKEMRGQFAQFDTLFQTENAALGQVTYVHAGALDQPLSVSGIYTFTNARGLLDIVDCMGSGCNAQPAGESASAYGDPAPRNGPWNPPWNGTLLENGRTGSGLLYRRNRYLDANTGAFTQSDPAGLGSGLNAYGFAGGDPVNFSDPFGLCPDPKDPICRFTVAGGRGPGAVLGTTLAGIGQAAQKWWDKHGETVITIGFALISEGQSLGSEEPLTAGALRGKTLEEIEQAIPKSWARKPSAKGGGTRYVHPENNGEQIRVQPGNPNDPNPVKQGPYCRISRCGKVSDPIPLRGNPTLPPR